jgi:nicotinamide-nucleotide amidase
MFADSILRAAQALMDRCIECNVRLVLAESCTGGLIGGALTALPGSSRVVDRGFVVYSYESKEQELGISRDLSEKHGAVSESIAIAMVEAALQRAGGCAQLGIAATGVSGPGGTPGKPPGLVHIAAHWLGHGGVLHRRYEFPPSTRDGVRAATVMAALELALECLNR